MKSLTFITLLNILIQTNFHIINAAAGSGKTYTLVLRYLIQLLGSKNSKSYRNLLALTFTNKAVNEMKERILETLLDLSNNSPKENNIEETLCSELNIEPIELARKADKMLHQILFEYGSFDIITLDKFTHRIIRSFSRELQLPYGFEVVLDPKSLLEETVNSIIDKVGKEESLTRLLTDFSLDKVNQNQSWNIQKDLDDFASILLNENHRIPLADLKKKSIGEHKENRIILQKENKKAENEIQNTARAFFDLIKKKGIERGDFYQILPNHFQKASEGKFSKLYDNQLEIRLLGEKPLYSKGLDHSKKDLIDEMQPQLLNLFIKLKSNVGIFLLIKRTLNSLTPLSLLQKIEERLESIQNEKEVRLLGAFNSKISALVQDTDAPFIYERLGERYLHYFLDEFQDTSKLQWSNLIPLISNALESESLSGEQGSLLIVGDPKQAIYRFRGGDIQQFVTLLNKTVNPFQVKAEVENLEINYRSGKAIVEFNNSFFMSLSKLVEVKEYSQIYSEGSQQKPNKEGGYVQIDALPTGGSKEDNQELYILKTLNAVKRAIEANYDARDIAVLVRKRDQASAIGEGLIQEGYSILSSESLVVGNSKRVQFVLAILRLSVQPNDLVEHKLILDIFWELSPLPNLEYHEYIQKFVHLSSRSFFKELGEEFKFIFSLKKSTHSTALLASEYILERFTDLLPANDPFLNAFLEDVFEFSSMQSQSITSYLKHWERQEDKLRIATPAGANAIHIMTIHQAKGLEFPVVILPFMDTALNPKIKEKLWFPFQEEPLSPIEWGWITASKEMKLYGEIGELLYAQYILSQQLDAYNVLYVALTRAKEQLYIITLEVSSNNTITYSHLFSYFAKQQGKKLEALAPYECGTFEGKKIDKAKQNLVTEVKKIELNQGVSTLWEKRLVAISIPDIKIREAQNKGLLIHEVLSKVVYADSYKKVLDDVFKSKKIKNENQDFIINKVKDVIEHPMISKYFERNQHVLSEQDVLVPNGVTLRPDRVNLLKDGGAVIIDYKTGDPKEADGFQIDKYAQIYISLNYFPVEKFLVYIGDKINVYHRK